MPSCLSRMDVARPENPQPRIAISTASSGPAPSPSVLTIACCMGSSWPWLRLRNLQLCNLAHRMGELKTREPVRLSGPARREQLLDVAKELALARGFHALSIEGIARAAGITRPVVYSH